MEREHLKHEVVRELRATHVRWVRNATALAGLALVVGCCFGLHPLIGGIVLGVMMAAIAISGMILTNKAQNEEAD